MLVFKEKLKFFKKSYKNKLTVIISLFMIIPLSLLCFFSFSFVINQKEANSSEKTELVKNTHLNLLDNSVSNMYDKISYILNCKPVCNLLNISRPFSMTERLELSTEFSNLTYNLLSPPLMGTLTIYTTNKYSQCLRYVKDISEKNLDFTINKSQTMQRVEKINGKYCISFYKSFSFYDDNVHVIEVDVPLNLVFNEKNFLNHDNICSFYKYEDDVCEILTAKNDMVKKNAYSYFKKGEKNDIDIISFTSPYIEGTFYIIKDTRAEQMQNVFFSLLYVLGFFLLIMLSIFLTTFAVKRLTKKLTDIVTEIELDDIKNPTDTDSEFGIIHSKLYSLIENLKSENDKILKMELELLNQKIAPHFLYNNLSTIKWKYKDKSLDTVIDGLVLYYRNAFQNNKPFNELSLELTNAQNYISLLQYTYDEKISYLVQVPAAVSKCLIPANTLQTLIENAFLHSINISNQKNGYIKVWTKKDGNNLKIIIENNLCEVTAEKLNENLKNPNSKKTATIITDRRIKLYYGDCYGIFYEKEDDILYAIVTLPIEYKKTSEDETI